MVELRAEKVERVQHYIPTLEIFGEQSGDAVFVSWGSTFGSVRAATTGLLNEGQSVAHIHLKNLNPLPQELGEVLKRYDRVIGELNLGQLDLILRARYLIETCAFTKVKGSLSVSMAWKISSESSSLLSLLKNSQAKTMTLTRCISSSPQVTRAP